MEIEFNEAFSIYCSLYYFEGISSVYMWDLDEGFACAILFKNTTATSTSKGHWDAIHVIEAEISEKKVNYRLTTSILLNIASDSNLKKFTLGGNLMRQTEEECDLSEGHLVNVGRMVEDMENRMRAGIQAIYFEKTRDCVNETRTILKQSEIKKQVKMQKEIMNKMQDRSK